jgi:uncharacterized membrane protein HdeD (DUF308 family)
MNEKNADVAGSFRAAAIVLGVLLLGLAGLAFAAPFGVGIAVGLLFGGVLLLGGVLRLIYAVLGRGSAKVGISGLLALLAMVAGVILLLRPLAGPVALTLVLGIYLLVTGVLELLAAFQWRRRGEPWGWMLGDALVALVLGAILLVGWPVTGLWAIGVLVGVHLLFVGLGLVLAGLMARPGPAIAARPGTPAGARA